MSESTKKTILRETLAAVVANWPPPRDDYPLVGFSSLKGSKWSGDLMVVGRFVNGWDVALRPWNKIRNGEAQEEFLQNVLRTRFHQEPCPVTALYRHLGGDPRTGQGVRSQFWRTIQCVAQRLGLGDDWTSKIVYSNLYRFGPNEGNPPGRLCIAQRKGCIELLNHEISNFKPRRILFLTGWKYADKFLGTGDIPFQEIAHNRGDVDRVGTISVGSTRVDVVVSKHPQGKKRTPLVEEIRRAFKVLES